MFLDFKAFKGVISSEFSNLYDGTLSFGGKKLISVDEGQLNRQPHVQPCSLMLLFTSNC